MARPQAASDHEAGDVPAQAAQSESYVLDAQVGFRLRLADQRHRAIFARAMPGDLTPRQWAALAKLVETGASPQNLLGRRTAMDAATIKGVVDRLSARGLVETRHDAEDGRRRTVALTALGERRVRELAPIAAAITRETLAPLSLQEQHTLMALLAKIS